MNVGMLWFDDSASSLAEKIRKGADHYEKKYGRKPELCLVHPTMLKDVKLDQLTQITVRPWRPVLPGHIWIGVEDKAELEKPKIELES